MKTCKTCKRDLSTESFHVHKGFKDGRRAICKECACAKSKEYYSENREKHLDSCRDWQQRNRPKVRAYVEKYRKKRVEVGREWVKNNPVRVKAQKALNYAVYQGKLVRPDSCQVCGCGECAIQGHHSDYSKPLSVIWVCTKCHGRIHTHRPSKQMATVTT